LSIKITVRDDEPLEIVLKRFKRICEKEGIRKAAAAKPRSGSATSASS
jgi:ribosomal protein S21